ncbi:DUF2796 domain-containing protein [Cycloclasticus sp.]|uniref:DUF2796 domain-containing protein n=1 Tax=Cycloclasticus sp. TaxID=2024830 RepID=UPI000C0F96E8|nr:DUF2796 domain-containing protein [Cycloclasticus sp.]PHR49431.1 MAG: metal ion ABC transporter substrate-binding protein [Cycloclasticus sp.]
MKNTLLKFVSFNLVFLSAAIQAEEATTNLDAHVHGVSELMVVAEENALEIQFKSPAMNLVGFEHQATSSKDIKAVEKAASTLRQHDSLLLMSNTNCKLTNTSVDLSKIVDTQHHDNDHDNSPNEDEHAHNNNKDDHDENHSEIMVTYKYHCEDSTSLPSITVNLFEFFTGIEEINTMWVNQTGQGAVTLRHNNRTINF